MPAALRLAGQIGECSPMSIRASKEAVMRGLDEPSLEAAIRGQGGYPAVKALFRSAGFRRRARGLSPKSAPPHWAGH